MCCGSDSAPPADDYQTQRHLEVWPAAGGGLALEHFPITYEGYTFQYGRIAYLSDAAPAPVVLVFPNYAGLKQFDIDVAVFLARVGYVGLAVDLYKDIPGEYAYVDRNPQKGCNPKAIRNHQLGSNVAMDQLLRAPKYWRGLMRAFLDAAYAHPAVKAGLGGAVGYCLGGQCVLEQVRAGHPIQAAVSFHGVYHSRPRHTSIDRRMTKEEYAWEVDEAPNAYNRQCKVLIEHGDYDVRDGRDAVSISEWKSEMDAEGIDWQFHNHARTPHGFALAPGVWSNAYTEAADRRSTLSMLALFAEVWPEFPQHPVESNACGTKLGQFVAPTAKL